MAPTTAKHEPLLTLDDVRAKRRDIVQGENELVRISTKLEADRKEFQQMLVFVPEAMRDRILSEEGAPDLFDEPSKNQPKKPVREKPVKRKRPVATDSPRSQGQQFSIFITNLVCKSPGGISHTELKAATRSSEYAARLEDQAKAYHRTISKLIERNDIMRHGSKFYAPSVYEVLKKNGNLPEIEEGISLRENGAANITLGVLQGHPNGLSGPDLKVLVGADPTAPKSVTEHGQYIYNVLATLIGSGRVVKNGHLYQVVEKATPRSSGASGTDVSRQAR